MAYDNLITQLEDSSETVRETAAWAVGELGLKDAVPSLIQLLRKDDDSLVRNAASTALGRIRDPAAVPHLHRALQDEDILVRTSCILSLGALRDARSVEPLKKALELDINAPLRRQISRAIQAITGVYHRYRSSYEKKIQRYLAEIRKNPRNGTAHNNLGVAYYNNGQFELAIHHCDLARDLGAGVRWLDERLAPHRKRLETKQPPPSADQEGALRDGEPLPGGQKPLSLPPEFTTKPARPAARSASGTTHTQREAGDRPRQGRNRRRRRRRRGHGGGRGGAAKDGSAPSATKT